MKIVIDLGCKTYGKDESFGPLIKRFKPDLYYGFDPALEKEGIQLLGSTVCIFSTKAAWLYSGSVRFKFDELKSGVHVGTGTELVDCFDLIDFLAALPREAEIIVKLDVEGAEYPLLSRMHYSGWDQKIQLVLVEWHTGAYAHGLENEVPGLRCEVEEW